MQQNASGPKLPTHNEGAYRLQWSSRKTLDCGVLGPRIEANRGLVFITTTTAIYSLGHRLCSAPLLQCLGRLSLPPSRGDGKMSTGECQGKVGRITSAGWQVTLRDITLISRMH